MENGEKRFQHYVLCSDDLGHDKNSIYFYNKFITDDIGSKGAKVDTVHYWSDGLSSQFKNQFNFTNLLFHEYNHHASVDWNFFPTSHGKRENDGVRGDVKNIVWRKTLQMKVLVTNLNEFVETAQKKFPSFVIVAFNSAEV